MLEAPPVGRRNARSPHPIVRRRVDQRIVDDKVSRSGKASPQADVGVETAVEEECGVGSEESCELGFEGEVERGVSVEKAGAWRAVGGWKEGEGGEELLAEERGGAEGEIVVRGEVDERAGGEGGREGAKDLSLLARFERARQAGVEGRHAAKGVSNCVPSIAVF